MRGDLYRSFHLVHIASKQLKLTYMLLLSLLSYYFIQGIIYLPVLSSPSTDDECWSKRVSAGERPDEGLW